MLPRLLPRRSLFAVPAAGVAGIAFPGIVAVWEQAIPVGLLLRFMRELVPAS
ncbi:MAG: hypothetical protein WD646_07530 [Actinomycetota bacterium]